MAVNTTPPFSHLQPLEPLANIRHTKPSFPPPVGPTTQPQGPSMWSTAPFTQTLKSFADAVKEPFLRFSSATGGTLTPTGGTNTTATHPAAPPLLIPKTTDTSRQRIVQIIGNSSTNPQIASNGAKARAKIRKLWSDLNKGHINCFRCGGKTISKDCRNSFFCFECSRLGHRSPLVALSLSNLQLSNHQKWGMWRSTWSCASPLTRPIAYWRRLSPVV